MRSRDYRRVAHGLYTPRKGATAAVTSDRYLNDVWATRLLLPEHAVFTHVTGARLRGWQLPALPEQTPIFAADRDNAHPSRPGLICARLTHEAEAVTVGAGIRVDDAGEILLRAARELGDLDLLIMCDSALRLGHLTHRSAELAVGRRRPGVNLLRRVLGQADGRAESAGESVLRLFHVVMEIPCTPQVVFHDERGDLLGRADLGIDGREAVHEFDGAVHRSARAHTADLRRDRGWAAAGITRRGFTLSDLLVHPATTMHELDRALGRAHRPRRLERWRALVDDSLYSAAGRERVMNRWYRRL